MASTASPAPAAEVVMLLLLIRAVVVLMVALTEAEPAPLPEIAVPVVPAAAPATAPTATLKIVASAIASSLTAWAATWPLLAMPPAVIVDPLISAVRVVGVAVEPMLLTAKEAPSPTPAAVPLEVLTPIETATTPAPAMMVEESFATTATVPGVVRVVVVSEAVVVA